MGPDAPLTAPPADALGDVVLATDADGRLTYLNRAWTALTGHPVEDSIGTPLSHHLDDRRDAAGRARCATAYGGVRWVEPRLTPVAGGGWCGILVDVTDRRRREARLAEAERRFRGLFDHAPAGMAVLATDGSVLRVNAALCRLAARRAGELLDVTAADVTHPDDLSAELALWDRLLAGELADYEVEKRLVRPDRRVLWVRKSVAVVRAETGEPLYAVGHVVDATAARRAAGRPRLGPHERPAGAATPMGGDAPAPGPPSFAGAVSAGVAKLHEPPAWRPLVRLADGRLTGLEACPSPEAGAGGASLLQQACRAFAGWRAADLADEVVLAVAITAVDLRRPDLAGLVRAALADASLAPGDLRLHVPEDALAPGSVDALRALAAVGVRVGVTGAGAGGGALAELARAPGLAAVVVAPSVLAGARRRREDGAVLAAVVSLGRSLGVDVVADGLADDADVRLGRELGCAHGQGGVFGAPGPAAAVEGLLRRAALGELRG